ELLAPRLQEDLASFLRDLLQRLEAVRREARADHVHARHCLAPQRGERVRGVWLEPFGPAEPRLEGEERARVVPAELGGDERRARAALRRVRVARIDHGARK